MLKHSLERGDTLVEVMLAVMILSAVVVGGFSVMNKGASTSYSVLERTETRAHVTAQLELLTYFRDQYMNVATTGGNTAAYPASIWGAVRAKAASSNSSAVNATIPTDCGSNANSFYIDYDSAAAVFRVTNYTFSTPATIPRAGTGLWVEAATPQNATAVPYVDLYVKACWDSVTGHQETLSSTVRLYDR